MSDPVISFGFAGPHLKMEGCAIHPDDTEADFTPEGWRRQLDVYRRDTKDLSPCFDPFTKELV